MQNIQPNMMQNFRQMVSEYHWLDIAESVSIAASAVGTVAGALSSQVVYAAAPLTVALSLNLANRYRLDENTEQYTKAAISDVRNVVESLYTSLPEETENAPPLLDLQHLQASISHLQTVTERLENKALTEDDWQMVNVRFLTLQESLERLTNSIGNSQTPPSFDRATTNADRPLVADGEITESSYAELEHRIIQLEQKNHEVIKPYLQRLTHSLQQVKQAQSLGKVKEKIAALGEELQQRTVVQAEVDKLTQQLQTLAEQQAQLNQQFLELPPPHQPVDISGIEAAIAQIAQDLSATKTQTTKRFKHIVRTLNPLSAQINQLQQLCGNLESSVEKVNEDISNFAEISAVENLENILNQVAAEIAELQDKIAELPPPFDPGAIEQQLQELTALVRSQTTEPTQFLTKQDIAPLVAAIKKIQKSK